MALINGRPDGKSAQYIYASGQGGVIDYRLPAKDMSSKEEASKVFQKVVNGTYRGEENLIKTFILTATNPAGYWNQLNFAAYPGIRVGDTVQVQANTLEGTDYAANTVNRVVGNSVILNNHMSIHINALVVVTTKTNIPVSGNFTQTDVIGDPANILATPDLANGWLGGWIPTIPETGNNGFSATRKGVTGTTLERFRTVNNGTTWTSSGTFAMTSNNLAANVLNTGDVMIAPYTAFAKQTKESTNKVVLNGDFGIGNVWSGMSNEVQFGNTLQESLIGKVGTAALGNTAESNSLSLKSWIMHSRSGKIEGNVNDLPRHNPVNLLTPNNNSPAVKALWYQTSDNQQLGLNFAYNELVYNSGGTVGNEWGDTTAATTYTNASGQIRITDGQSTYTNLNGDVCLFGTNELALPMGYTKNQARVSEQVEGVDL